MKKECSLFAKPIGCREVWPTADYQAIVGNRVAHADSIGRSIDKAIEEANLIYRAIYGNDYRAQNQEIIELVERYNERIAEMEKQLDAAERQLKLRRADFNLRMSWPLLAVAVVEFACAIAMIMF